MKSSPTKRIALGSIGSSLSEEQKSSGSNLEGAFDEAGEVEDVDDHDVDFQHSMWQNMEFMDKTLPKLEDTDADEREEVRAWEE